MSEIATLNGITFNVRDALPPAWPCECCGKPIWVGRITPNGPDDPPGEHFDVWEEVPMPDWAQGKGYTWCVDIHRCIDRSYRD